MTREEGKIEARKSLEMFWSRSRFKPQESGILDEILEIWGFTLAKAYAEGGLKAREDLIKFLKDTK